MSNLKIILNHHGTEYEANVATIEKTRLGYQDHGILTADLQLRWASSGVSAGGYCLDMPDKSEGAKLGQRMGTAYGLDHIIRILETVGVDKWEDLTGRRVYVLFPASDGGSWGSVCAGIANIDTGKALIFKEHAQQWLDREAAAEIDAAAAHPAIGIDRDQLDAWVGRTVTDEEVDALDQAIPNSTVPESIRIIVENLP